MLGALYLVFTAIIVEIFTSYFFIAQEAWNTLLSIVLLMSPIIIIEGIVGGHIGYQVYCRVKGLLPNTSTK
jgi:hypothetical protein